MQSVLIIEDNLAIRENTAELLELNGYRVFTAKNGNEGFELVKSTNPNVILCDIVMPETDGRELLKLLKKDKTTSGIPLIFLSAGSAPPAVQKGLMQGADAYLSKPFDEQELLDAVKRNMNGSKK